ncbi:hypothetical protein RclHR1_10710008 [Rhizophagus clarus]|nr:hypothetical protein RclHR1_10710008 [Rhizophagus clarus]
MALITISNPVNSMEENDTSFTLGGWNVPEERDTPVTIGGWDFSMENLGEKNTGWKKVQRVGYPENRNNIRTRKRTNYRNHP